MEIGIPDRKLPSKEGMIESYTAILSMAYAMRA